MLLHGFIDNRSVFVLLRRSLAQHGRQQVESLNYSPLTCDIRTAAELLGRHIEEICERTGSKRGRHRRAQPRRADRAVLRTAARRRPPGPHARDARHPALRHGVVPLANAHPIVRQMRPGSTGDRGTDPPAPGCRTHFVSFWSDLDHLMEPLETACIDHPDLIAQNVQVSGIGHLALPVHPAVATGIRQALDTPLPKTSAATRTGLTVARRRPHRRPDSGLTGHRQRAHSIPKIEQYSNPRPNPCPSSPETRPNARFRLTRNLRKIVAPAYRRVQSTALLWQPLLSRRKRSW